MQRQPRKSLMRSLGEFVGHIVQGARTDPSKEQTQRRVMRHDVQEEERRTTEGGKVTLRRTTIEEVEFEGGTDDDQEAKRGA